MNTTTLLLTSIGVKNCYEIISASANLLSRTTKVIVNNSTKHKDVKQFFIDTDIVLKIDVIGQYLNEIIYSPLSSKEILIAGIRSILEMIKKELKLLQTTLEYNQKMLFGFSKKETDSSVISLEQLLKTLELRFILLQNISQ